MSYPREDLHALHEGIRRLLAKADPDYRRVVEYITHIRDTVVQECKSASDDRAFLRAQGAWQRLDDLLKIMQNPELPSDTQRKGRSF